MEGSLIHGMLPWTVSPAGRLCGNNIFLLHPLRILNVLEGISHWDILWSKSTSYSGVNVACLL